MLEMLPTERWHELTEIFAREFDAEIPNETSTILADLGESGEVKGFVVLELLGRIGQVWQSGAKSRAMLDFFNNEIPPGNSIIAIASDPRFEGLCTKYGMRRVEGTVYRKDF